jgi:hypothetical protein
MDRDLSNDTKNVKIGGSKQEFLMHRKNDKVKVYISKLKPVKDKKGL